MKKIFIFTIAMLLINGHSFAGDKLPERANKFSFGFQLNSYQNDFGLGIQLTSPYFAQGAVAIRGRANMQFYQYLNNDNKTTWSPYGTYQLGVIGVGGTAGGFARFYGEGGIVLITPSSDFSSLSTEIGGYGLFGFEFFMSSDPKVPVSYFIELGGIGTGATADKVAGSPIYSNGFLISVGFRGYLK
jgi:hypothetical protein